MNTQRLRPLQELAEAKESEAAKNFVTQQDKLSRDEQRLNELNRYLHDYSHMDAAKPVSPALLRNRHEFVARLNEAVKTQSAVVDSTRAECDQERQRWINARGDHQALDKLSSHYQSQEDYRQNRRQQHEQDELAARLHARRLHPIGQG